VYEKCARSTKLKRRYVILLFIIISAVMIRSYTRVGLPDIEPTVQFSGVIFYLLVNGLQIIIFVMSARAIAEDRLLMACMIALSYGVYQAFFGWRIGLLDSIIIIYFLFYFYKPNVSVGKFLLVFTLSLCALQLVVMLEDAIRVGANKSIIHAFLRIDYFGYLMTCFEPGASLHLIDTNNFLRIINGTVTASEIHNKELMGEYRKNGLSSSGFGSMYITGGLLFVFFTCTSIAAAVSLGKAASLKWLAINIADDSITFATVSFLSFWVLKRFAVSSFGFGALKEVIATILLALVIIKVNKVRLKWKNLYI